MISRYLKIIVCGVALLAPIGRCPASELRETPAVKAVARVNPSVVNINTEKTAVERESVFGNGRGRKINGMGTGIVIDERGYIVTNYHVVAEVETIRASMHDRSNYEAKVVRTDKEHDLAIIKVESSKPLKVAPFGTSSDIRLAEKALAIGNAYGYDHTVTEGIVSALGRDVEVNETQSYKNLIQTDASINPGNSGGPLVNMDGEVIGINVAIRAGATRIGFAIPIDDARRYIAKLINIELLNQTYHGVVGRDSKNALIRNFLVDQVHPESPAAVAGLKQGDVVTKVGHVDVNDGVDFERALIGKKVGEPVEVQIKRADRIEKLHLNLAQTTTGRSSLNVNAEVVGTSVRANNADPEADQIWQTLGLKLVALPSSQKHLVGPKYEGGMRVVDIRPESQAAANGFKKGDILIGLEINGGVRYQTISQGNVAWIINESAKMGQPQTTFYIIRGQETLFGHLQIASK